MLLFISDYFSWDVELDDGSKEEVPMGGNGMVSDGSLYTETLGCCIGIAVYNPEEDVGYFSHLDTVSRDRQDYMIQFNVFMDMVPDGLDDPEVLLAGGADPEPKDEIDPDFFDGATRSTYHVKGLKPTTERILNQNFDEVEVDRPGSSDTELYLSSDEGIQVYHRDQVQNE
jgi:hypothetical protein